MLQLTSRRPHPATWVALGIFVLVTSASALMAALVGVLDLAGGPGIQDLCGNTLSGFPAFWERFGWVAMGALAVAFIASAVLMPILVLRGQWMAAVALVLLTLLTAPIPWQIQAQRQAEDVGCFQF